LSGKISEFKKHMAKRAELAPEAAGCMRLVMTDNTSVYVENHKGVAQYTEKRVTLNLENAQIIIGGSALTLEWFGAGVVAVGGEVSSILFEKTAGGAAR